MESFSSNSLKRARAHADQVPPCLVDGCTADLSKCRDYHRRHKVCEIHSKTPMVTIRGLEQRFCQQCSRFHSLVEFDEGKRSCRKRLDGHNRRRRKPQPDSLSLSSGSFLPSHQGVTFLPYSSSPQIFSTSSWIEAMKTETDIHSELTFGVRSNMFPAQKINFPFLQTSSSSTLPAVSALSLLSSPQPAAAREIGLGHMVQCEQQQQQQQQQQSLITSNLCYNNNNGVGEQDGSLLSFDGSSSSSSNNFQGYGLDLLRSG